MNEPIHLFRETHTSPSTLSSWILCHYDHVSNNNDNNKKTNNNKNNNNKTKAQSLWDDLISNDIWKWPDRVNKIKLRPCLFSVLEICKVIKIVSLSTGTGALACYWDRCQVTRDDCWFEVATYAKGKSHTRLVGDKVKHLFIPGQAIEKV